MEQRLIYDIGMHIGQDTINYLKQGFKVIAIEADPLLAEQGKKKFKKYIDNGSLIILNVGISDKEGILPFYVNKKTSEWSSFDLKIASRNNTPYETINIPSIKTSSLMNTYGVPYYMKIDIEGYDYLCVNDLPLTSAKKNVKYVSCEATTVSLIDTLHEKGYTKFKLINQAFNFMPMNINLERNPIWPKFVFVYASIRLKLRYIYQSRYPYSSSGPIPENTKGEWLTYEKARQLHTEFYVDGKPINNKSWFDCHATF